MSQWNGDLKIYPDDLVAVVSPGVLTANINQEAEKFGLMYPLIQAVRMYQQLEGI